MTNTFKAAIAAKLDTLYAYPVYTDDIQQGFAEPCFRIQTVENGTERGLQRRSLHKMDFELIFALPAAQQNTDSVLVAMGDNLVEQFIYVESESKIYHCTQRATTHGDNALHFTFTISHTVFTERAVTDKINTVDIDGVIK